MSKLWVLVAVVALGFCSTVLAETSDRLTTEHMLEMVAKPVGQAKESRLDTAERLFEIQYEQVIAAHGPQSKEVGDLLHAMGIGLYNTGAELGRAELKQAAIPYLRRAVAVKRNAWGPHHPELALVLNDYGLAQEGLNPPVDPLPALKEALAIRRTALGLRNPETVAVAEEIERIVNPPDSPTYAGDPPTLDRTLKKGSGHIRGGADDLFSGLIAMWIAFMVLGVIALGIWLSGRQAGRQSIKHRAARLGGD
jgi:hypothetical protein